MHYGENKVISKQNPCIKAQKWQSTMQKTGKRERKKKNRKYGIESALLWFLWLVRAFTSCGIYMCIVACTKGSTSQMQ